MDKTISIAKAIGIILMVIGHSGCPAFIYDFIYMFHMPLFFFLSGWCFKEKYINSPYIFIKRKVIGLYLPFVSIALCFLCLHNSFINIGILEGEMYSLATICDRAKSIIVSMHKEEQLIGAFWFLPQLFYASFIFFLSLKFIKSRYISLLVVSILAVLLYIYDYTIPYTGIGFVSFYGAGFMFLGYILKDRCNINIYVLLCLFIIVISSSLLFPSDMFIKKIYYFLPYMIVAVCGCVLTIFCSGFINSTGPDKLLDFLTFLGNNTLYILTLHFLSFKIVSLFLIRQNSLPLSYLTDFPVLTVGTNSWAWLFYSIVGFAVPVIIAYGCKKLRNILQTVFVD